MSLPFSACHFDNAIVRLPARSVVHGLRDGDGANPDFTALSHEHTVYVGALERAGVKVTKLAPLEAFPDSVFVEDPALVFPEGAIILRSGAATRAEEGEAIEPDLREHFDRVLKLPDGAHADGGDILTTRDAVYIGLSERTDEKGAKALAALLGQFGRKTRIVATPPDILHFKSDCGLVDDETVLTTQRLAETDVFDNFEVLVTPSGEEAAANALRVNGLLLIGDRFPRTIEMLEKRGVDILPLPTTEIGKIDAGLSCMSLRWRSTD